MDNDNNNNANPAPMWHCWKCVTSSKDSEATLTRVKILNAAYEEIHRVGFQNASIQNILRHTGLTKGALYYHFKNKNELGHAVIDEIISRTVHKAWIEPLAQTDDPVLALQQLIMYTGNLITVEDIQLGCPLNNLSQEMSSINEEFRDQLQNIYTKWMLSIQKSIEKGMEKGYVTHTINAQQFATVFVATLEGCIGIAKNANSKAVLIDCGAGMISLLNTLRPSNWESGDKK